VTAEVVILAGGKGTRLRGRLGGLPKPMLQISGKPLLEHQILLARSFGFKSIVLLVAYRPDAIRSYFGDGSSWDVDITYLQEAVPRGTAGAVLDALNQLSERFIVMYGDTMLNVDLAKFWKFHTQRHAGATLFVHPNDHPCDSDLVEMDETNRIRGFHPYPHDERRYYANLVNAGLYVVERSLLHPYKTLYGMIDFGKHLFPLMLKDGRDLCGYKSPEYIKDVGTPERIDKVEADFHTGLIGRSSLVQASPGVFLDRDGTLNVEVNRVCSAEALELLEGVSRALKRLNRSGYRTAVITNQPVVARGDCNEEELNRIHNKLETLLGREGAYVDAIYYCPHHPHSGFRGEREELKITCSCRKPATGLIDKAVAEMNISTKDSWLIGDATVDVMTARNAGMKSIVVRTGHGGLDNQFPVRADFEFFDLESAVNFILDRYPDLLARAEHVTEDIRAGDWIVVGGLARAGKSTWASVLRYALEARGVRALVIPLDNWLKSAENRGARGILDRYDMSAIEAFARVLAHGPGDRECIMPFYDRAGRLQRTTGECVRVDKEWVLVFDGVVGLLSDYLMRMARKKIYVDCPTSVRRKTFFAEYRTRALEEMEIERLYEEREDNETQEVLATRSRATMVLEGPKQ
jgi:histidinol-phosphate phosphatase family protein